MSSVQAMMIILNPTKHALPNPKGDAAVKSVILTTVAIKPGSTITNGSRDSRLSSSGRRKRCDIEYRLKALRLNVSIQ